MLKIWGRPNSVNVQKAMWTVGELGLEHERIDVGGAFGGLDTDDYGALNPNRLVPTLDVDGKTIWESNVIVRYLASLHDAGGLSPSDPYERACAEQWMDWKITRLMPPMTVLFWGLVRHAPEYQDKAMQDAANEKLFAAFDILDSRLAGRDFVMGDRLTIGDIPVGAATYRYFNLGVDLPDVPNVRRWYEALTKRPAFAEHVMIPLS